VDAAYSVLNVAYLISPYLIIRRSMIIADETYCGVFRIKFGKTYRTAASSGTPAGI